MERDKTKRIHHGHNIKRTRETRGIKQEALAGLVSLSQQSVSNYEQKKNIDLAVLQKFAAALGVPLEILKNMEEDPVSIIIENNNHFEDNDKVSVGNIGEDFDKENVVNNSTIEKIEKLYERLLEEKEIEIVRLKKEIATLKNKK